MVTAENDCMPVEGDITSSDLSTNSIPITGNCQGSYIYISVPSVTINASSDFTITIEETADNITHDIANINFVVGVNKLEETKLASKFSGVIFSCKSA